jgi:serine/threonine-protein kinase HipA
MHTPHESDTALDLYTADIQSTHYQTYGHYGRENFLELAKRLDIVETRAARILDQFTKNRDAIIQFINGSFLSDGVKTLYLSSFMDKLKRIQ